MDSLTQIALGGTVGALIGGKTLGRKSVLIGAICGTIPDLDSFLLINTDPITAFTHHRGFSHSILFPFLVTLPLAWVFSKIKSFGVEFKNKKLHFVIFLALLTHSLLDALTIYGTQLLWPLTTPPIGTGTVFIIDPLYTIPLLIGVIWFLLNKSVKSISIALIISSLYLLWGLGIQQYIVSFIPKELPQKILVQTTPFNTMLWRILIVEDNQYKVGYYSIFDKEKNIEFKSYPNQQNLVNSLSKAPSIDRLKWFTKGFYSAHLNNDKIIMTDLRMGLEPDNYFFGFIVAEKKGSITTPIPQKRFSKSRDMSQLSKIWDRIWHKTTEK